MTERFQYVWKPQKMCDEWKVDGNVGVKDKYTAITFMVAGEWYVFVDMLDMALAPRYDGVEMITEGEIFNYGRALWELSR